MKTPDTKYRSVYAGVVIGTRDPQNKGRIRVKVPQILGESATTWAAPMGGVLVAPAIGARVNIQFIGGDVTLPVYSIPALDEGIDSHGNAVFNNLSVNDTLTVGGTELSEFISQSPRGIIAYAAQPDNSDLTPLDTTTEIAVMELNCEIEDGRMYRLATGTLLIKGSVNGAQARVRLRDGGASSPNTSSDTIWIAAVDIFATNSDRPHLNVNYVFSCDSSQPTSIYNLTPGTHRVLLTLQNISSGQGSLNFSTGTGSYNPITLYLEDMGPAVPNLAVDQSGSGGGTNPVEEHTTTYTAIWSASYNGDGSRRQGDGSSMYQGQYSSSRGIQKSLVGFDYGQIESDLAGADVTKCEVYLYFSHWYYGDGGTAVIGTHSSTVTSDNGPSSYPGGSVNADRKRVSGWGRGVGKWVSLGAAIGNEFKNGQSKGIAVGPAPSTSLSYYGYADGDNMDHEPLLRITYTK